MHKKNAYFIITVSGEKLLYQFFCKYAGIDYTIDSSLTVPIAASNSGGQYCLNVNTIQDNLSEGTEQFELYFENLPNEFAAAGMRDTVCVSIVDDEGKIYIYNVAA